jgi:hypothetical protein
MRKPEANDYAQHERTYHAFVRAVVLLVAHVLVLLLTLAWVFSGSFGTTPLSG